MFIRSIKNSAEITAGDNTKLRELFNPLKDKELNLNYSLAYAEVEPGETTFLHSLKSSEVYYILSGKGEMNIDQKTSEVNKDDVIYIPPKSTQSIKNISNDNLCFLCIVEPAWKTEDETIN